MSDEPKTEHKPEPTPAPKFVKPSKFDNMSADLKTLTTSMPEEMHNLSSQAAAHLALDKAGFSRLTIRLFIDQYYRGNGVWDFPPDVHQHAVYADSAPRAHLNLNK